MTLDPNARAREERDPRWPAYLEALRGGATERAAAVIAGIPRSTITGWVAANDELQAEEDAAREEYLQSRRDIVEGIARGQLPDVRDAAQQARVQLAAATWLLEKRDPERFGQRTRVDSKNEHTGPNGAPLVDVSRERLAELVEEAKRRLGE